MKRLIVCSICGETRMCDGNLPLETDKCVGCGKQLEHIYMISMNTIR